MSAQHTHELLEALEGLLDDLRAKGGVAALLQHEVFVRRARAAIAKAKGETQ